MDFLLIDDVRSRKVFPPPKYKDLLTKIYVRHGISPIEGERPGYEPAEETRFNLRVLYDNKSAVVVIDEFGADLEQLVVKLTSSAREEGLNTVYFDLPLDDPGTASAADIFARQKYVFGGLMFMFHNERDYLRLQYTTSPLDMNLIYVKSDMAKEIKRAIEKELRWTMK
jgi:hypothetical protein